MHTSHHNKQWLSHKAIYTKALEHLSEAALPQDVALARAEVQLPGLHVPRRARAEALQLLVRRHARLVHALLTDVLRC